ncbi:hypothetical protein KUTeg_012557 [Tegillarca granosa]|uniref:Uncharacterized protein n=1 Tax=Tegillarca granosa TaxID=220873 RepID=A0ABQ9F483_TEGGR|nr:hypothetical protein KUTeg_012557 [Tegillarca granosa]
MPKKGGKKGKGGKKKKAKTVAGADLIIQKLIKTYDRNCALTESLACPGIRNALKACLEDGKILNKFILEAAQVEKPDDMAILLEPLLATIRQERYIHINDLHVWKYPMSYENAATLALLLEKGCYPLRYLELLDCIIDGYSVGRLSRSFRMCETLTHVILDYNEFGDEGCKYLCKGLEYNSTLIHLSMCYCDLGIDSGKNLGAAIASTAVREIFLDGNNLECEGAMELIKLCAEQAEYEAFQRAEAAKRKAEEEALKAEKGNGNICYYLSNRVVFYTNINHLIFLEKEGKLRTGSARLSGNETDQESKSDSGKKKKKKGKKKKKKEEGPPPVGPWVFKLHLADNGIDNLAYGQKFAPIIFTRILRKLIMHSEFFEELDLDDNLIGDLAAREIIEALEFRKEGK